MTANIAAGVVHDFANNTNGVASLSVTYDTTAPAAPTVIGTTPTNNATPTWTWTTGGGNGTDRFRLDNSDLTTVSTTTTNTSYTPGAAETKAPIRSMSRNAMLAGNWSASGSFAIVIDINALEVSRLFRARHRREG